MSISEKFHDNMERLFLYFCEINWICPYCGSDKVAECWEILEGRFKDGSPFGPYGGIDECSNWICDDCNAMWGSFHHIDIVQYHKEWKYKGKI